MRFDSERCRHALFLLDFEEVGVRRIGAKVVDMAKWWVWGGGVLGVGIRLLLVAMGSVSLLGHRVEVVSPVTSLSRCKNLSSVLSV